MPWVPVLGGIALVALVAITAALLLRSGDVVGGAVTEQQNVQTQRNQEPQPLPSSISDQQQIQLDRASDIELDSESNSDVGRRDQGQTVILDGNSLPDNSVPRVQQNDTAPTGLSSNESAQPLKTPVEDERKSTTVLQCSGANPQPFEVIGTDITFPRIDREQEAHIGAQAVDSVLTSFEVADAVNAEQLATLRQLLAAMNPNDGRAYEVTIVRADDEINAFAVPGGRIFFTTGILSRMPDEELAFVLAHEIAHIGCRHALNALEREAALSETVEAIGGFDVDKDWFRSGDGRLIGALFQPTFSRRAEREADLQALELMRAADLDPGAAERALQRLANYGDGPEANGLKGLFSTHPPTRERIADIRSELESDG